MPLPIHFRDSIMASAAVSVTGNIVVGLYSKREIREFMQGLPGSVLAGVAISAVAIAVTRKSGALRSAFLTAAIWWVFGELLRGEFDGGG